MLMQIKKVTIGAVSIKKTNKEGKPYTWNDKKRNNPTAPRTMVSIKVDEEWYMGWSYKDGSAAESLKNGDVVELMFTEDNGFKNWKFPKPEDKVAYENEELKRKLAAFESAQSGTMAAPTAVTPANNFPSALSNTAPTTGAGLTNLNSNPSAQDEPEF